MTHCFSQSDQSLPGWGWFIKLFPHFIYLSVAHKSVTDVVSMLFAFQCKIDTDLIIGVYESVPTEPHDIKSLLNQSSSSSFKAAIRNSDLCRWFVKVMASGIRLNHGCTSTDTAMRHSIHFFHFASYMDMLSSLAVSFSCDVLLFKIYLVQEAPILSMNWCRVTDLNRKREHECNWCMSVIV